MGHRLPLLTVNVPVGHSRNRTSNSVRTLTVDVRAPIAPISMSSYALARSRSSFGRPVWSGGIQRPGGRPRVDRPPERCSEPEGPARGWEDAVGLRPCERCRGGLWPVCVRCPHGHALRGLGLSDGGRDYRLGCEMWRAAIWALRGHTAQLANDERRRHATCVLGRAPTNQSSARPRTSRSRRWSKTPTTSARMRWSGSIWTTSTSAAGTARC